MLATAGGPTVEDKRHLPTDMSMLPVLNVSEQLTAPVRGGTSLSPPDREPGSGLWIHYPEVVIIDETSRLGRGLRRLLEALDAAEAAANSATFRTDLIAAVPHLRRFALSLSHDAVESEDLVQFTLLKAWEHQGRFQPGTRLIAWLFTILRNGYLNGRLKRRREVPDPDGLHAARLCRPPDQETRTDVRDLQSALDRLEPAQRAALMLIAVDGLSYEEAAVILGCPRGTVKSRVSRARDRLTRELGEA